jgi:hypothetical protein
MLVGVSAIANIGISNNAKITKKDEKNTLGQTAARFKVSFQPCFPSLRRFEAGICVTTIPVAK